MIIKLDTQIDIKAILTYLEFVKKTCPPFMKKDGPWGGWSITSSTGDVHDGWQTGEKINSSSISIEEKNSLKDFFAKNEFNKPTAIYNTFIEKLLSDLKRDLPNLQLTRLRIAVLKPHPEEAAYWHQDGEFEEGQKLFRFHIPILTNDKCFFEYPEERHHLKADGSMYLVEISRIHRALNLSNENRYHLIADASLSV